GKKSYPHYNLVNPALAPQRDYVFKHPQPVQYFSRLDTLEQVVLGEAKLEADSTYQSDKQINFIKAPLGKGKLLLHTSPQVFTNFFMLSGKNYEYTENLLSYLDLARPIYYDAYHDPGKAAYLSPLYIILTNKYLKWGYYMLLIGVVLFVIFEGKRKQKAIKVLPPFRNKTYEYTRTIAGLYLDKKDHTAIAHKKIDQFLGF